MVARPLFVFGEILSRRRQRARAEAAVEAAALYLCGRRVAGGEGFDRGEVRRVLDAWRSAGTRWRKNLGFASATREAFAACADEVWRGGLRDRARNRARSSRRGKTDHRRATVGGGLCELSAVACRDAARAARFAGRLLRVESRVAVGIGRDGGAGCRACGGV